MDIWKILFYIFSSVFSILILIGLLAFDNFRDRLYLLVMLIMYFAVCAGIAHLSQKPIQLAKTKEPEQKDYE